MIIMSVKLEVLKLVVFGNGLKDTFICNFVYSCGQCKQIVYNGKHMSTKGAESEYEDESYCCSRQQGWGGEDNNGRYPC